MLLCVTALAGAAVACSALCAAEEAGSTKLPEAVAKTFKAEFPKGEIANAVAEKKEGVDAYDIQFKEGGLDRETNIAADGTLLTVAALVDDKQVPDAALKAIQAAAEGGKIRQITKIESRYDCKDGKITKLAKAKVNFEADLTKSDKTATIVVDNKDNVVVAPTWAAPKDEAPAPKMEKK
jgi:hypothetical protein